MDFVEVFASLTVGFSCRWIGDSGEGTDGWREFASHDEFGIGGGGSDMALVPKFSATEDLVEFQRVEGGTIFAWCFCVSRPDGW